MSRERRGGKTGVSRRRADTRLRSPSGRKPSSKRWLERQLKDPYVHAAKEQGYRSRAAFKLIELDERFRLLGPGKRVVDLGAAPGGWSQVAAARVGKRGVVVAADLEVVEPIAGVEVLAADAQELVTAEAIRTALNGQADVVLSDMAAPATGHARTDHLRVMGLCEVALEVAEDVLVPGGSFVAKMLKGGTEKTLLERLKRSFREVRHVKPAASRAESSEVYVVALGYRGRGQGSEASDTD